MRKIVRKSIAIGLSSVILFSQITASAATICGYNYNTKVYDKNKVGTMYSLKTFSGKSIIGVTKFTPGRLIKSKAIKTVKEGKKKTKIYENVVFCKIAVCPCANDGKYGVAEYTSVKMHLPSNDFNAWAPKNDPPKDDWNISLSSDGNVTASTTVESSRLDVSASVKSESKTAEFKFDYKPIKSMWPWNTDNNDNKYFVSDSMQYPMISINTAPFTEIKFDIKGNYTYSSEKHGEPYHVKNGACDASGSFTWNGK